MLTREWVPGVGWVTEDASFASYGDPSASSAGWWSLMQQPRYQDVLNSPDLTTALGAIGRSGYATDPNYGAKLSRLSPASPAQQAFWDARIGELTNLGVPPHLAELGARQSALETGWGRSAPGNNFYGIKAPAPLQVAQAGRSDVPQGLMSVAPPPQMMEAAMGGQAQPGAPAPMTFGDRLGAAMQNPAFLMGASILANNVGNYGAAAPAIGRGMQQGAAMYAGNQEDMLQNQFRQMQMDQARRKMAQEEQDARYVEEWVSRLPPDQQRLARVIGVAKYVELISKSDAPVKKYEYTKGGILDTTTGKLTPVAGQEGGLPAGYRFDADLAEFARTDPEKAITIQEQRNKDRSAGVTEQGVMRKEFLQQTDEFRQTQKAAKVLPELLKAPKERNSKAADLALIVQLAKAMDPTSVVREGEVYTIQRQGGLFDALKSYLGYVTNQGQLTDAMRQDLAETVMAYYRASLGSAREKQGWYRRIAEKAGVDPELIVGSDFEELTLPTTVPPPPAGFTERVR